MDDTMTSEQVLADYFQGNLTGLDTQPSFDQHYILADYSQGNLTCLPQPPSFEQHMKDCVVIEGSAAVFEIVVAGCPEPTIEFFINEAQLEDGAENVKIVQANGHYQLTIQNCQISKHKGFVLARATNELDHADSVGRLDVVAKSPPSFEQHMKDCVVIEGSAAVYEVVVSGCPAPTVKFFINEAQLLDGQENVTIAQANGHYQLTIQNCQIGKHKGVAWARATNELGHADSVGRLNVVAKPEETLDQQSSTNNANNQEQHTSIAQPIPKLRILRSHLNDASKTSVEDAKKKPETNELGHVDSVGRLNVETKPDEIMDQQLFTSNTKGQSIVLLKDQAKGVELNNMIDQCHRFPIQQAHLNNSIGSNLFNGVGTSTENENAAQNSPTLTEEEQELDNDDDVTIIEDVNETTSWLSNSSDGNLSEQPTQEQAERIAEMEPNEPNEHLTANPIIDSENNDVPNTILSKSKPSVNISITPNEPTAPSVGPTVNENTPNCENNEAPNANLPKTVPSVSISIAPEPHNFIESHVEMDLPSQSALSRKRQLPDNTCDNDSVEIREKRRLVVNDKQLESGGHCSRDVNHDNVSQSSANECSNFTAKWRVILQSLALNKRRRTPYHTAGTWHTYAVPLHSMIPHLKALNESCQLVLVLPPISTSSGIYGTRIWAGHVHRIPTTAQTALNIPSGRKMKISYIYINTGNGNASFKTSDGKMHYSGPLSQHILDLRRSEPVKGGCDAHIAIWSPFATYEKCDVNSGNVIAAQKKFKTLLKDIHSISHFWANGYVEAEFGHYSEFSKKALPQSDFFDKLFGRNRSLLECNSLEIKNNSGDWPLSVIMNAARRCQWLTLKQTPYQKYDLDKEFLEAIYEVKLPQHIDIELQLHYKKSTRDMIEALTERFKNSTGQCFKFTLFSARIIPHFPNLKNKYGTLKMKKLAPNTFAHLWDCRNGVLIQQRHTLADQ
ncbi:immunoglobulin i-set domain-containing protein [Ditylenchus destructor]|nr:immunoglobulin i-set domain-containing protein [Ditylenchus destructor]